MKNKGLKFISYTMIASSFIIGTSVKSSASTVSAEKPLAGITLSFDKYCDDQLATSDKNDSSTKTVTDKTEIKSKSSNKEINVTSGD